MDINETLKAMVATEESALRLDMLALLTKAVQRRATLMEEVQKSIGFSDLPEHPGNADFLNVLDGIRVLITETQFEGVLERVGFEGETAQSWYSHEVRSAPKRHGRRILELIFIEASTSFCNGELIYKLQSLMEDVDKLMDEVVETERKPAPLTVRLDSLVGWDELPTRLKIALKNKKAVYVGDVLLQGRYAILRAPNLGKLSVDQLEFFLARHGHRLSQDGQSGQEMNDFVEWSKYQ